MYVCGNGEKWVKSILFLTYVVYMKTFVVKCQLSLKEPYQLAIEKAQLIFFQRHLLWLWGIGYAIQICNWGIGYAIQICNLSFTKFVPLKKFKEQTMLIVPDETIGFYRIPGLISLIICQLIYRFDGK